MAWGIRTIYTSNCEQMDPNSYLNGQNFIPYATSVICKKPYWEVDNTPFGSRRSEKLCMCVFFCVLYVRVM